MFWFFLLVDIHLFLWLGVSFLTWLAIIFVAYRRVHALEIDLDPLKGDLSLRSLSTSNDRSDLAISLAFEFWLRLVSGRGRWRVFYNDTDRASRWNYRSSELDWKRPSYEERTKCKFAYLSLGVGRSTASPSCRPSHKTATTRTWTSSNIPSATNVRAPRLP